MTRVVMATACMALSLLISLAACVEQVPTGLTDPGSDGHRITPNRPAFEPIAYTDQNYDFNGGVGTVDDLLTDATESDICGQDRILTPATSPTLPFQVRGVATSLSNLYYKVTFDTGDGSRVDEKNFGAFFIQDQNEGMFVLRQADDIEYASFGDLMTLNVTAMVMRCGQKMIYAHTLIERNPAGCSDGTNDIRCPIYYRTPTAPFTLDDVNEVYRVEGIVVIPDEEQFNRFGDFAIQTETGFTFLGAMSLDIKDRQFRLPEGARVQLTAPVISSFGLKLNFDHEGQITILEGAS